MCRCPECEKYKAIRKGKRRGKERFLCLNCGTRFESGALQNGNKIDGLKISADHLDRASYRMLSLKYGIGRNKICELVNNELNNLPASWELTVRLVNPLNYSGYLIVDGKYIPIKEQTNINWPEEIIPLRGKRNKIPRSKKRQSVRHGKTLIWGLDYLSHDIPHLELGDGENCFVIGSYFKKLKEMGYPLISLTVDDKEEITRVAKRYYPEAIIQLCTRHYACKIGRELSTGAIKIRIKSLEKRIDNLFVENSSCIPISRPWSQKTVVSLINQLLGLQFKYELVLDFEKIILATINAKDYKTAEYEIKYLLEIFWPRVFKRMRNEFDGDQIKKVRKLITDFKDKQEYLLSYLKYPHLDIPKTNNMIEGGNSQLELRLGTIKGFESIANAKNYLNAWIIKRRLTPFTDCRGKFRELNGKSPLECVGVASSIIKQLKINDLINQKSGKNKFPTFK